MRRPVSEGAAATPRDNPRAPAFSKYGMDVSSAVVMVGGGSGVAYSDIGSNMFRFGMNAACIVRSVMLSVSGVG